MATTTTPRDKASIAREMIRAEADGLEAQHKTRWPNHPDRPDDADFKRGVIHGLRQAEGLLGEGT